MPSIVTYDVPEKHSELKQALFKLKYVDKIPGLKNCKIIYFPNTTLYHETKTPTQMRDDVEKICLELKIKLERCVATLWGPYWAAICGEDFK